VLCFLILVPISVPVSIGLLNCVVVLIPQAVLHEPGRHGGEEDRGAQEQRAGDALPARRPVAARLFPAGRGDSSQARI